MERNRRELARADARIFDRSQRPTAFAWRRSRCNAIRHALTAETVIGALEDAGDYEAFEAALRITMLNPQWSVSWCCD
jgi:hypothetical protein